MPALVLAQTMRLSGFKPSFEAAAFMRRRSRPPGWTRPNIVYPGRRASRQACRNPNPTCAESRVVVNAINRLAEKSTTFLVKMLRRRGFSGARRGGAARGAVQGSGGLGADVRREPAGRSARRRTGNAPGPIRSCRSRALASSSPGGRREGAIRTRSSSCCPTRWTSIRSKLPPARCAGRSICRSAGAPTSPTIFGGARRPERTGS